ncbi:ABC transporter ATP-binding protein [Corynebacterium liangguodongii]|uniref:Sulfonate ABC transporter ATP-binding protein n=1 Tax=Corynebacterium liangguodongii TaxID=2079535 RepID=A0A2S0WGL4_9CORY|nr:ABC transporter ATP-binding protein [Corynebacterium liangguodongii]AWB84917.1 sulfonate ABC transporter ATP-binding protein [Corynebacterium liangguodongii]PWB99375.1 ABC transporter ATP-binding protein [Corynebacterium liangguodongii]
MTSTLSAPPAARPDLTAVASVSGLQKFYGAKQVLRSVSLHIPRGGVVALIGRSGSGKSTILRVLAGLTAPDAGEVDLPERTSVAFQEPRLLPWKTVVDNVALGLNHSAVPLSEARSRARTLLGEVHLGEADEAWPLTLSGGQAQRVSLARALVSEPDLLLLDEPFGALDALTRITAQNLLLRVVERRNLGALIVTHDVAEAVALADTVILLDGGEITHRLGVDIPGPKEDRRNDPRFGALTAQLLQWLEATSPA